MPVIKLSNFGGMIPAVDGSLLPDNQAQIAENAWLYSGAVEGLRVPVAVRTLVNPVARRVFRIPIDPYDKNRIPDSYWLEFTNPDVDVISSPAIGDSYERFYWAFSQLTGGGIPQYNTKARIIAGLPPYTLGVPRPTSTPKVSRRQGVYSFAALGGALKVTGGGNTVMYVTRAYARDPSSLQTGVADVNPALAGASTASVSGRGVVERTVLPSYSPTPRNVVRLFGAVAEIRYSTVQANLRVTISDSGVVTVGPPAAVAASSSTDPYTGQGVQETRAYVYTWVSEFGEESAPSLPTLYTGWSDDDWYVGLTVPTGAQTANRSLTKTRIYRTITGSTGATTYFFVAEVDISTTVYVDTLASDIVSAARVLDTTYYDPPPSDLSGMVSLPNGMVAAWRNNEIWFCEPYKPHAWPTSYTISVESTIVGMGVIGQSLIVCTTGSPYAVTGVNPSSMAASKIAVNEPCISRASIVSTERGVLYASPNGIAVAVPGSVSLATKEVITKDLWLDTQNYLSTTTLRAATVNGAYYAWGSVRAGCFQSGAFDPSSFMFDDYTGAYQGAIVDFSSQRAAWVRLRSDVPTENCFVDRWTGEIFLIRAGKVYWLDLSPARAHQPYLWRSKRFEAPNMRNFEAMRVQFKTLADTPELNAVQVPNPTTLASDMYGIVRVYVDDVLRFSRELRKTNELFRLPSGFKGQIWEIEIEARIKLYSVEMATSAKELGNA